MALRMLPAAIVAMAAVITTSPARAAAGPTCEWFRFQEYAQLTLDKSPVWDTAPALDPDGDGIAYPELTLLIDAGVRRSTPPEGNVEAGIVTEIVDGGTINVLLEASRVDRSVRTIVTNAPEKGECYGPNATRAVERIIPIGTKVWLQRVRSNTDRNDRLLRHVWYWVTDGTFHLLEHETVMRGSAFARDYGDGSPYLPYVADAMSAAELGGFGLWSKCRRDYPDAADVADVTALAEGRAVPLPLSGPLVQEQNPVAEAPVPTQAPIGISGNCDSSYPSVCNPSPPPDLDCGDIAYGSFQVLQPDPHHFDGDYDGVGCEG